MGFTTPKGHVRMFKSGIRSTQKSAQDGGFHIYIHVPIDYLYKTIISMIEIRSNTEALFKIIK